MFIIQNLKNIDKEKQFVILSLKEITVVDILIFSSLYTYPHVCVPTHTHVHIGIDIISNN